jgi:hypothetical protein
MTCDKCHAVLEIGSWPWCPHDTGASFNVQPDSVPGGFWTENGWSQPRKFYSRSEHLKALDTEGLQMAPRHVPNGKLALWSSVDLEAARALVSRGTSPRAAEQKVLPPPDDSITVTDAGWTVKP